MPKLEKKGKLGTWCASAESGPLGKRLGREWDKQRNDDQFQDHKGWGGINHWGYMYNTKMVWWTCDHVRSGERCGHSWKQTPIARTNWKQKRHRNPAARCPLCETADNGQNKAFLPDPHPLTDGMAGEDHGDGSMSGNGDSGGYVGIAVAGSEDEGNEGHPFSAADVAFATSALASDVDYRQSCPVAASDADSDADVLRTWRFSCPALQRLWPADADVEKWEGVTLDVDGTEGRVVNIRLGSRGLMGEVPAALGQLVALKELDLRDNQLTRIPEELGNLAALETLFLNSNRLTSVPLGLGRLTALKDLLLGGNQLIAVPAELGNLAALERLGLGGNQLESLPAELGRLTSLTELYLRNNYLTSVPFELKHLTALRALYLNGNLLRTIPATLGELPALRTLRLHGNSTLLSLPAAIDRLSDCWGVDVSVDSNIEIEKDDWMSRMTLGPET